MQIIDNEKEKMENGKFKQCSEVALVKLKHCFEVAGLICHLCPYCHIHLAENVQLVPLVPELLVLPVSVNSADIHVSS